MNSLLNEHNDPTTNNNESLHCNDKHGNLKKQISDQTLNELQLSLKHLKEQVD